MAAPCTALDPDIALLVDRTGIPISNWPGSCYAVAEAIVRRELVPGELCYGIWLGFIHSDSLFAGRPFSHHAWIEDGDTVIDPTRWVFECKEPYLFTGAVERHEYDRGGNVLREAFRTPCPPNDPDDTQYDLISFVSEGDKPGLSDAPAIVVSTLVYPETVIDGDLDGCALKPLSKWQVFWVANTPLDLLGAYAAEIYQWICDIGLKAAIPLDNRLQVLRK
jgi:hypothetical protein